LVGDSAKSIGAIARELGLGETALRRWVQQAEIDVGWGNYKIVGQGPFLAAAHGNCHFGYPN
jgi:hypothetical protein